MAARPIYPRSVHIEYVQLPPWKEIGIPNGGWAADITATYSNETPFDKTPELQIVRHTRPHARSSETEREAQAISRTLLRTTRQQALRAR